MISTNDFKNGMAIEVEGKAYTIIEFLHVKPGKGGAFVRTKLKSIATGAVLDKTFRAGEKFRRVHTASKKMLFLYSSQDEVVLMDNETYEQLTLPRSLAEGALKFIKDNMDVEVQMIDGKAENIMPPTFVELEVDDTQPGVKGDTVSGGSKPATLENGTVVNVPLFIKKGDRLKIDTRTGEYVERV